MTTTADTVTLASPTLTSGDAYLAQVSVYRFSDSPTVTISANGITGSSAAELGWNTVSVEFTGTGSDVIRIVPTSSATGKVYVDNLAVTPDTYANAFFDGSTPDSETAINTWNGDTDASTSNSYYLAEALDLVTFADDGSGVPYVNASVSYGTELLFNQAEVTSPAGTAIANNEDSQTKYGITQTNVDTLLSSTTSTDALAAYYVSRYGEPEYRFQELNVSLDGLSGEDKTKVLNIELGEIVIIKFTPNGVGDAIERYGQIIGINHDIGVDRHNISYSIGSLQFAYLVLNDVGFGILDGNALGF